VTDVVERYLTLGLRLGRHVDGLVDAYYGPPELAREVEAETPAAPQDLVAQAEQLALDLAGAPDLEPQRRAWLADQVRGLYTYAGVLAGEELSYSEEVRGCYGVEPVEGSTDGYRAAHARLDELLPGEGSLFDRHERWRTSRLAARERLIPAFAALVQVLRARTRRLVDLPEGEDVVAEEVRDEPWWAFNYYLGGLRSRIVVNADIPTTAADLVMLAAHEAFPGHHTERCVKEQLLVRERGLLEETILLVPTPQSVVCEGIAETALDTVLDEELCRELEHVLAAHGLDADLGLALEVDRARRPLRSIGLDAALILHERGGSSDDASAHVQRWALRTPEQAEQTVRFVTDPTWRAYAVSYTAGLELCEAYIGGDESRLRRLLTEQVRVADLIAARP
jgi:hypothetical protein